MNNQVLQKHLNEVNKLCTKHGVKSLYVFGSVLSEKFDEKNSDLDFLVELSHETDPLQTGETMLSLWNDLEETFQRPVDLLRIENIQNPILKAQINRTKHLLYAA